MKCKIPSYISDFVSVDMWQDTDNFTYYPNNTEGFKIFDIKFCSLLKLLSDLKLKWDSFKKNTRNFY